MNKLSLLLLMCISMTGINYAMEQEIQNNNNQSINIALIEAIKSANVAGVQAAINLGADVNHFYNDRNEEKNPLAYAIDLYSVKKQKIDDEGNPVFTNNGFFTYEYPFQTESLAIIDLLIKRGINSGIVNKFTLHDAPAHDHVLYYALNNYGFILPTCIYWPLIEKLLSLPLLNQPDRGREINFENKGWLIANNAKYKAHVRLLGLWNSTSDENKKQRSDVARVYYHLDPQCTRLFKAEKETQINQILKKFFKIVPELYEIGPRSFFKVPFTLEEIKAYLCDGTLQHIIDAIPQTKNKMPQKLKFRELGINYRPQQQKESNTEITQNDTIGADTTPSTEKQIEFSLEKSLSFEPVAFKKSAIPAYARKISSVNFN